MCSTDAFCAPTLGGACVGCSSNVSSATSMTIALYLVSSEGPAEVRADDNLGFGCLKTLCTRSHLDQTVRRLHP